ncbi:MAG TPA: lytic murein transglycosylase [Solirubrobacteraceae bacterium]|nr:lytic murein transglycosylase [Solirubrobacteraceae bacterium]
MNRSHFTRNLIAGAGLSALAAGLSALALVLPTAIAAADQSATTPASQTTGATTTTTPPTATTPAGSDTTGTTSTPAPTDSTPAPAAPAPSDSTAATPSTPPAADTTTGALQVQAQSPQAQSGSPRAPAHAHAHANTGTPGAHSTTGSDTQSGADGRQRGGHHAPSPSALTPPFPSALGSPVSGVPDFFIESFRVPPFLLPIYQAAGTAYGVPWQVLAAINEVETDYGRDLNVSSAGAEGWMQFLPSTWAQYGVDANGDGFQDPYNPADAIFAAARYLKAAGGEKSIRTAVFSYNHSQTYVDSVMLRAQLLGGTPADLLSSITGLTEARFPVHAASHFSDGFPVAPASSAGAAKTLVGTTIYSQDGAPVIAVQDGQVTAIGESPSLGRYVSLRDAYGNTYTYAQLGSVAALYPELKPHDSSDPSTRIAQPGAPADPAPSGPASAGVQPRSPLSEGAVSSGLALGAAAGLGSTPAAATPAPAAPAPPPAIAPNTTARVFRSGANDVYLHPLHAGVQVIAGTVLGHVGSSSTAEGSAAPDGSAAPTGAGAAAAPAPADAGAPAAGPHMLFQLRPAGAGAPLIDPKPILDGWVQLERSSIFRAKGENPFLATSPTVGQVLLESKEQLEQQVLHDKGIHLYQCGRQDIQTGQIDRRVLATLEFLSVSALKPTVSALKCGHSELTSAGNVSEHSTGDAVDIAEINGIPIAGHQGAGSITDTTIRKLLNLQGTIKPHQIISLMSYPGTDNTLSLPDHYNHIHVGFRPLFAADAAGASAFSSTLSPDQWIKLIARLGEIPNPTVGDGHSPAALPDNSDAPAAGASTQSGSSSGGH